MTTTHINEIHFGSESSFELGPRRDHSVKMSETISVSPTDRLAHILFEQLEYLLQYPDEGRDRLSRVTAILFECFQ